MNSQEKPSNALVPVQESEKSPVAVTPKTSYWGRVAIRYTWIWRMLLILLLIFAALFMLLFSRAFTYDSVFCFFRDLQAVSSFVSSDYGTVTSTYTAGDQTVLSYRGGIAFINSGGVEIYSPDGERLLNAERPMQNPRAMASRKYLVAYDNGGTSFVVTNSYAELFRGETEFPILGVCVSDSGHFALITSSDQVLSQVLLYDNNFNLIQRFQRASATVDVSLADNGKRIAILGANAAQGTVASKLDIFQLGDTNAEVSHLFQNEIPLSVGFTGNRNVMVLTNKAVRCCDTDQEIRMEMPTNGTPVGFTVNDYGALLVLETDKITGTHRVLAFEKKGDVLYDGSLDADIHALALGDEELFLLTKDQVIRLDANSGESTAKAIGEGAIGLFVVDDRQVRICYPAKADILLFENT
ncbi:MAG: hypothetical protein E7585_07065 [Ruminococcaceae bacterium]|nr:hypothetical protein [Oscillospiraceae bacterium]